MSDVQYSSPEDLTPPLRKALVEIGLIIPTTPEEVILANRHLDCHPSEEQIAASFARLESLINGEMAEETPAAKLRPEFNAALSNDLALAARNGAVINEAIRARIEADIEKAISKPRDM